MAKNIDKTTVVKWFKVDREHSRDWRTKARRWFQFVAGEQWEAEDVAYLKEKLRPVITFNRTAIIINAVVGSQIENQPEVVYSAVEPGDVMPNNVLQGAGEWFRRTAHSDYADADAFLHTCICGMGWTETIIDYEEDIAGKPSQIPLDPLEMYWDASATLANVRDAKRLWRVREMDIEEARAKWPGKMDHELHADWAGVMGEGATAVDQEQANLYQNDDTNANTANGEKSGRQTVMVVHLQWKEKVDRIYTRDEETGKEMWLPKPAFAKLNARMLSLGLEPMQGVPTKKMVWMQALIGRDVLEQSELPIDEFTWGCTTGYKDHVEGTWYGLVRGMMDPQMWANKWLSQTLHILNSNAKGGVAVEVGAVENINDFEESWANSDEVTWLRPGGKDRIMPKNSSQPSASFFNLMEFAITSIRDSVGVNLEQLGMRGAIQAASLEQQRKDTGLTILAPILEPFHYYREMHGYKVLAFIQRYLNDGRLIRIVGETNAQYVPLALNQDAKYDVYVDEAGTGANVKDRVWSFIAPMIDRISPQVLIELLPFSPLPATVVSAVQQAIRESMKPDPMAEQAKQAELQKAMADVKMTDASTIKTMAEAKKLGVDSKLETIQLILDALEKASGGKENESTKV
jgi:hypothetical protein